MYELKKKLEKYLRVNLLGPDPRLIKKENLLGRGLTKVEKHCSRPTQWSTQLHIELTHWLLERIKSAGA